MLRRHTRGDTLVEVMLASAILALVLAGTYNLSNRATRLNQSSYERTRASNLLQEQAELLRAARDENGTVWTQLSGTTVVPVGTYYDCRDESTPVNLNNHSNANLFNVFNLDSDSGTLRLNSDPLDRVKVTDNLYFTWVNKISSNTDYIDFHVYTCWEGIGAIGDQVAGLAVRLIRQ